jgi:hypothetical protein
MQFLAERHLATLTTLRADGGRWLTLEGTARVSSDPADVATAVEMYAARYREPGTREDRVAIEIAVDRILGRA